MKLNLYEGPTLKRSVSLQKTGEREEKRRAHLAWTIRTSHEHRDHMAPFYAQLRFHVCVSGNEWRERARQHARHRVDWECLLRIQNMIQTLRDVFSWWISNKKVKRTRSSLKCTLLLLGFRSYSCNVCFKPPNDKLNMFYLVKRC